MTHLCPSSFFLIVFLELWPKLVLDFMLPGAVSSKLTGILLKMFVDRCKPFFLVLAVESITECRESIIPFGIEYKSRDRYHHLFVQD